MLIARTDAQTEAPELCPHTQKSLLIRKDPYAEKEWKLREGGDREWDG